MSVWAGLLKGVADQANENYDRKRQIREEQTQEARKLAKIAKDRTAQSQAVKQQIAAANSRFGVSEGVLVDAYKAGTLDDYLELLDTAGNISPEQRENLWKIPKDKMVNPDKDYFEEIDRSFGVIRQGVQNLPEKNDVTVGNFLYDILGGSSPEEIRRSMAGTTVDGYDAGALFNMEDPSGLGLPQGNWDYDAKEKAEMDAKLRGRLPSRGGSGNKEKSFDAETRATLKYTLTATVQEGARMARERGIDITKNAEEQILEAALYEAIVMYMRDKDMKPQDLFNPSLHPQIVQKAMEKVIGNYR